MLEMMRLLEDLSGETLIEIYEEINKNGRIKVNNIALGDTTNGAGLYDRQINITDIVLNSKTIKKDLKLMTYCIIAKEVYRYEQSYKAKVEQIVFEGTTIAYRDEESGDFIIRFKLGLQSELH